MAKEKVKKKIKEAVSEESLKAKLQTLAEEKAAYYKENKLKTGKDYTKDKTHGEYLSKLNKAIKECEEAIKEIVNTTKEAAGKIKESGKKIKKAVGSVVSKYEYPKDCVTKEQRKKYRRDMRNAAKKDEKPSKPEKTKKPSKKEKQEDED